MDKISLGEKKGSPKIVNLCLICLLLIFLLIGCSPQSSPVIIKDDPIDAYTEFVKDVSYIQKELNPTGYIGLTRGEKLNKQFTSFPDFQKLDSRKFDAIKGETEKPSRYEFFYLNKEETILVRINLIYAPEYKDTEILSIISLNPGEIEHIDEEYQNLLPFVYTSYLIPYKNGLAQIDFFGTKKSGNVKDQYRYVIDEGESKFLPSFQEKLLVVSGSD